MSCYFNLRRLTPHSRTKPTAMTRRAKSTKFGAVCDAFVGFVGAAVVERVPELFPNLGQSGREMKDLLHESSPSRLRLGKRGLQSANFGVSFVLSHRSRGSSRTGAASSKVMRTFPRS
jgi:hypothetical protein